MSQAVDVYRTTLGQDIQVVVARGRVQLHIRGRSFLVKKYNTDEVALKHAANDCLAYMLELAADMGVASEVLFAKFRQQKTEWTHELGGRFQREKERRELEMYAADVHALTHNLHRPELVPMRCSVDVKLSSVSIEQPALSLMVFASTHGSAYRQYIERVGDVLRHTVGNNFDVTVTSSRGGTIVFKTDLEKYGKGQSYDRKINLTD